MEYFLVYPKCLDYGTKEQFLKSLIPRGHSTLTGVSELTCESDEFNHITSWKTGIMMTSKNFLFKNVEYEVYLDYRIVVQESVCLNFGRIFCPAKIVRRILKDFDQQTLDLALNYKYEEVKIEGMTNLYLNDVELEFPRKKLVKLNSAFIAEQNYTDVVLDISEEELLDLLFYVKYLTPASEKIMQNLDYLKSDLFTVRPAVDKVRQTFLQMFENSYN